MVLPLLNAGASMPARIMHTLAHAKSSSWAGAPQHELNDTCTHAANMAGRNLDLGQAVATQRQTACMT